MTPKKKNNIQPNTPEVSLTPFQWEVLKATLAIPLGETRSYQWVADRIGRPGAVRAVGQALRRNPFPLIIPCHRVIRSDGELGGYAGRMDSKKRQLLEQEKKIVEQFHQHCRPNKV